LNYCKFNEPKIFAPKDQTTDSEIDESVIKRNQQYKWSAVDYSASADADKWAMLSV
jgi:hypothetical protein